MSDELTRRLRELAEAGETPPAMPGAGVRSVAVRRRRRRTTGFLAGGCVAATLAAVLTVHVTRDGAEQGPSPLASASRSTPAATRAASYVTVDLSRRVLTADGRELPISAGRPGTPTPTPTGLMTVTAKDTVKLVSAEAVGFDDTYEVKLSWVLELTPLDAASTAPGETPRTGTWIAASPSDEKAPGNYDTTPGWIALRRADAEWLYGRLKAGAVVEIRGAPATTAPTPTS